MPGISLDQSLLWSYQDGGLPGGLLAKGGGVL